MPKPPVTPHKTGDFLVDYEEKVFEDVKAEPGEKALVTFHTVAFEGSIGLVNLLQATRLLRKGFETSVLMYGPGVTIGLQRGFPKLGDEAFPGHLAMNSQLIKFMKEGGKAFSLLFIFAGNMIVLVLLIAFVWPQALSMKQAALETYHWAEYLALAIFRFLKPHLFHPEGTLV